MSRRNNAKRIRLVGPNDGSIARQFSGRYPSGATYEERQYLAGIRSRMLEQNRREGEIADKILEEWNKMRCDEPDSTTS